MFDWLVLLAFVAYLALMLGIGFLFSRRQEDLGDYYLGGRKMNKWVVALSTDMDGDATAGYAAEILKGTGARVTRLAFGLPADSGIAYSDPLTLRRAIVHRIAQ